jgi:DNA-binding transcriptional LysR family regulator
VELRSCQLASFPAFSRANQSSTSTSASGTIHALELRLSATLFDRIGKRLELAENARSPAAFASLIVT